MLQKSTTIREKNKEIDTFTSNRYRVRENSYQQISKKRHFKVFHE
jgi:hypothetical protein